MKYSPDSTDLTTHADFRLLNGLLKSPHYKIPEHLRNKAISCIEKVLDTPDAKDTTKLQAVKNIILMEKHNLEVAALCMPKRVEHKNVSKMSDVELVEALNDLRKRLPPVIDAVFTPHD